MMSARTCVVSSPYCCRDAPRGRASRCDIVHGLDIYFGLRVWRDDPRHNCLLLGRLDVEFLIGWACIFVPGLNRTDWHVIQIVEVEIYYLTIDNDDAILR